MLCLSLQFSQFDTSVWWITRQLIMKWVFPSNSEEIIQMLKKKATISEQEYLMGNICVEYFIKLAYFTSNLRVSESLNSWSSKTKMRRPMQLVYQIRQISSPSAIPNLYWDWMQMHTFLDSGMLWCSFHAFFINNKIENMYSICVRLFAETHALSRIYISKIKMQDVA